MNTYFNALNASFPLVKKEVNVIDFMFVELLRQVDPEMYEQVFRNRMLFYYPDWDIHRWDEKFALTTRDEEKEEYLRLAYDEIFLRRHGVDRDIVLSLLSRLFPKVARYRKPGGGSITERLNELEADKRKRIYHPYYFMIYFSLHVEEGYLSAEELDGVIEAANEDLDATHVQEYFIKYFRSLTGAKRYRFLEKISRSNERLNPLQAKALAAAIASEADKIEYDELDIGEFGVSTSLILVLANRFKDTQEITDLLRDVIIRSTTEAFALRIIGFVSNKERNNIFELWDNVNGPELESTLMQRLKKKYFSGGTDSIYSKGTWREWQALVWWAKRGEEERANVRVYLEDEFARRPSSIGRHIHWLWSSISDVDGRKLVDGLFPLSQLAEMAKGLGPAAYSTEAEKNTVLQLINREWPTL